MNRNITTVLVVFGAVIAALILFFGGFFIRGALDGSISAANQLAGQAQANLVASAVPTLQPTAAATDISADDDPARGPAEAAVTIIEFADYQCPYCKRYVDETLPLILSTYGAKVRYVFRDFPISQLHPQAVQAAEAADCANEQGKFWEYHDLLYQNQGALDAASLKAYAGQLGLNQATFDACLDTDKYADEVQADFQDALAHGVTGAPTFFVNGRKLVGALSFAQFQQVIEEVITSAPTN